MLLALLSRRLRTWLLLAVVAPLVGTALEQAGARVTATNPALGGALSRAGRIAKAPSRGRAAAGTPRGR